MWHILILLCANLNRHQNITFYRNTVKVHFHVFLVSYTSLLEQDYSIHLVLVNCLTL